MNQNKLKVIYWVLITPVALNMFFAGIFFVTKKDFSVDMIQQLGYPDYFLYILGTAKILGSLALMQNWLRGLKEWAYAGYCFNLMAAVASHVFTGDTIESAIIPLVTMALLMCSYWLWTKLGEATETRIAAAV